MTNKDRRKILQFLMLMGVTSTSRAFWFSDDDEDDNKPSRQIHELRGEVRINGIQVDRDAVISPGDEIITAENSKIVFHQGKDAYLLRSDSKMILGGASDENQFVDTLRILSGAVLSVFGSGHKEILTPTATAGIRGTGTYMEVEEDQTYLCTCYGEVDLSSVDEPDISETLVTTHHESPRYIRRTAEGVELIKAAPINHSDAELIMLEATVGREPPFGSEPDEDAYSAF